MREGTGRIRRIVNDSTAATETYIAHNLPDKTVAAVTPIGLCVLIFAFNWKIGLFCMIPAVIGFLCMMSMMGKGVQEKMAEYQNALEAMSAEATEYVRGIPVVKTFSQTVNSFTRFKSMIDNFGKWATDYTLMLRGPMIGFMTCINAIFLFIVIAAYVFVGSDKAPAAGDILNIMYYIIVTPLITVALTKVAYSGEAEMTLIDAHSRVKTVMDIEPLQDGDKGLKPLEGSIELRNVSFRYKDAAAYAVDDVSAVIKAGEHAAFVGPSGGGKTTVSRLAARFWDVTSGRITLGGMDVGKTDPETLLKNYSIVFQDVTLFNNSIMENIRIGRSSASDEDVMEAARMANCEEFIERLPEKYNTNIGENGSELSGGERQRISIARAFLKDAPVILLDEATASLDAENETVVQEALSRLIKNKTVLIIAHRMRTIANADHIVVLKDGVVAEDGTPEELVRRNGIYKHMCETQRMTVGWKM